MRNLTTPNQQIEDYEKTTTPGMAHWAGTGPAGATCGKCKFWSYFETVWRGDHTVTVKHGARCEKYWRMTGRHGTETIEEKTSACRHYEARPKGAKK
jgi:hypothetical protein